MVLFPSARNVCTGVCDIASGKISSRGKIGSERSFEVKDSCDKNSFLGEVDDGTTCRSDKWNASMEQKRFCAPTVIHGLLEIQKVRDKFKDLKIQLTYAESTKIGNAL